MISNHHLRVGDLCRLSFIDDATMFLRSGYSTISEHPMPRSDQNIICDDVVLEDTIPSSSSFKPLVLLRHEPEDLEKIQKLIMMIKDTA